MNAWKHTERAEQIKVPGPQRLSLPLAPLLNPSSIINTKVLNQPTRKDSRESSVNPHLGDLRLSRVTLYKVYLKAKVQHTAHKMFNMNPDPI